jgi:hypothetical protein
MILEKASQLTKELLDRKLTYDPVTGMFKHIKPDKGFKNKEFAGCLEKKNGYRVINLYGRTYKAHRLAWLTTYGEWPSGQIDHINGDIDDNRIDNLRIATPSQNMWNSRKPKNNTSGIKGVSCISTEQRWTASIKVLRKSKTLGWFKTKEEAAAAYRAAALKYHGEFARLD